jgi:hypothetical protein
MANFILVVVDPVDLRAQSWFVDEKSAMKIIFHLKITWVF